MPQRATYKKAATVAYAHPMVARGFIVPLDKFARGLIYLRGMLCQLA